MMSAETVGTNATAAPRARKKKRTGLWVGAFVVVAAAGGAYYWKQSQPVVETMQPLIATVAIGDVENSVAAAGNLQPFKTVAVGAQASGLLEKLYVEVGDEVAEGDILASIDARVQQNRVDSTKASLASAYEQIKVRESAVALAKSNLERLEMLKAAGATSAQEYDTAKDRVLSAEASCHGIAVV
jgi:macrolide-specific efflux system membrane fusion protein